MLAKPKTEKDPHRASVKELLPYVLQQRKLLTIALVLGALAALLALAQPVLVGKIIERVQMSEPLGVLVALLVSCVVVGSIFSGLEHYTLQRMGEGVVLNSRRNLIRKLVFLPIPEFDRRRSGDLVSRIGSDTTALRAVLTQGLVEAIAGNLVLVGAVIGMLVTDAVLFFATAAVLAAALLVVVVISARMRPLMTETQQQVGDLAAGVDRAISSIRTIRANGASEREATLLETQAEKAFGLGLRVARLSALIVPLSFIALQLVFLVVIGFGGWRVAHGDTTISELVMFLIFVFLLASPLGQIFGAVASVNGALGALGRIQEVTRLDTETATDAQLAPAGELIPLSEEDPAAAHIEFSDVHFTYRSAAPDRVEARSLVGGRRERNQYRPPKIVETPVLHGVSFSVPRGKRVALVGPSGAGKSTILGLIERFSDPDSGVISFGGIDLRNLDRAELRAQIGYVEQDAPVLAGTVRDNLLLSAPNASDAECEAVLRQVNLGGLLDRAAAQGDLATGLDAEVGDQGILLSGGEKQRLAIARALLANTPVLLLDESTANLDGVNEAAMRDAINAVAADRTLVVIAHRLATVVDSDLIIVLDEGRVLGQGTHNELIETVPLYRELAQRQLLVRE
ncbi:ABC transporter ATP-binding protein [Canibacter zhoujuaniae]|uniref:ABC transporter ATP-binding protein n=1 Tax=Canibacter zhoujuaniae TaxID=2708343 RepID=UPI00141F01B9|nr:ABC transporter ATP-binding protein [Canibacter zhoujuaniae]